MTSKYVVTSVDLSTLHIGLRAEDEEAAMMMGEKIGRTLDGLTGEDLAEERCVRCDLDWAHDTISELMTAGRGRALELERALYHLLAWTNSGQCPDCDPFREAPSEPDWQHAHDCGLLETANEARGLIGLEPEDGHHIPDAPAEMTRLAEERTASCWKDLRTQLDAANSKSASLANDLKLVMEHRNNLWRDLDAANARIAELEKGEDEALERLDILEERLGDIAAHVGCEREYSNLHDHVACIYDAFDALRAELERGKKELEEESRRAELGLQSAKLHFDALDRSQAGRGVPLTRDQAMRMAIDWWCEGQHINDGRDAEEQLADLLLSVAGRGVAAGHKVPNVELRMTSSTNGGDRFFICIDECEVSEPHPDKYFIWSIQACLQAWMGKHWPTALSQPQPAGEVDGVSPAYRLPRLEAECESLKQKLHAARFWKRAWKQLSKKLCRERGQ